MDTLLLMKYNNYLNRTVKYYDTVRLYYKYADKIISNINFNPNDYISTTHIVNDYDNDDYAVVINIDSVTGSMSLISRWFITEATRTRGGQYNLQLRRDVIVDNIDVTLSSICHVDRGWVDNDNPLIYNSENIAVNQIKRAEIPLKDSSGCGWIVGYFDPSSGIAQSSWSQSGIPYTDVATFVSKYGDYTCLLGDTPTKEMYDTRKSYFSAAYKVTTTNTIYAIQSPLSASRAPSQAISIERAGMLNDRNKEYYQAMLNRYHTAQAAVITASDIPAEWNITDETLYDNAIAYDGKYLYGTYGTDTTAHYYKISIVIEENTEETLNNSSKEYTYSFSKSTQNTLWTLMKNAWTDSTNDNTYWYFTAIRPYKMHIELARVSTINADINIPAVEKTNIPYLNEGAYSVFCIPCPPNNETCSYESITYTRDRSMAIAQALVHSLQPSSSGGHLYDIQLLPYKPTLSNISTSVTSTGSTVVGKIYYANSVNFSGNIEYTIDGNDAKLNSIIKSYRLVAPNYSNDETFNPYKNYGVASFHYTCSYKPYTPYINIHINYSGLYGTDWDDNRGLILGGDYSLPMLSDAWETYEIQNKNYANIFDRQMQHVDISNAWNTANAISGAISGTVGSAAILGGMYGAGVGAIGAGASAIGGAADIAQTIAMQRENKSYQQDMYSMNLQTIQAKPNTLVKSAAYNINSRVWPFIEVYSCTDIEKSIVEQYLTTYGYNINAVGKLSDYIRKDGNIGYIRATVIKIPDISDDAHIASAIRDELAAGCYIGG